MKHRRLSYITSFLIFLSFSAMVHAQDAGGQSAKVDTFKREIHLEGDLDEAQRKRLLEIAGLKSCYSLSSF